MLKAPRHYRRGVLLFIQFLFSFSMMSARHPYGFPLLPTATDGAVLTRLTPCRRFQNPMRTLYQDGRRARSDGILKPLTRLILPLAVRDPFCIRPAAIYGRSFQFVFTHSLHITPGLGIIKMLVVPVQFFSYSTPAARRADIVGRHPKAPPSVANTWPGGAPQKDHDGFSFLPGA